jgi:superfamily II DNA or RNA helicase
VADYTFASIKRLLIKTTCQCQANISGLDSFAMRKQRFLRSKQLRALLWQFAQGKCQICGCELPDNWHADHKIPWSQARNTNIHQMQALCPTCNQRKSNVQLRKHQLEMLQICDQIVAEKLARKTIILSVTPGGGKSLHPVIAAAKLIPSVADAICWIAPRSSLQEQAESVFIEGTFRNFLGHAHTIRLATNDYDPCRKLSGYVTTYQALVADKNFINAQEFDTKRYILFLDEVHHVAKDSSYDDAISRLVSKCKILILASGTLVRSDGKEIAYMPYKAVEGGKSLIFDSFDHPEIEVIRYTRTDAISDKAIIPLYFTFVDGRAEWIDETGENVIVESLADARQDELANFIYVALKTDYALQLLDRCLEDWLKHREVNPRAKMLVVSAKIEQAQEYAGHLKRKRPDLNVDIAVSRAVGDDFNGSVDAKKNIKRFKSHSQTSLDVLVTVAMAYEGLDVPSITHIACLTHIRSTPWIEQMVTRSARIDRGENALPYELQAGYIFAPDDRLIKNCFESIRSEGGAFIRDEKPRDILKDVEASLSKDSVDRPEVSSTIPLSSETTRSWGASIEGETLSYEETEKLSSVLKKAGMHGHPAQLKKAMDLLNGDLGLIAELNKSSSSLGSTTPSELENLLRENIENHVRKWTFQTDPPSRPNFLNGKIKEEFGKPRDEMTLDELRDVWNFIKQKYPLRK